MDVIDNTLANHSQDDVEDADFALVAQTRQMLVLPENSSRGEAVEFLSRMIPANEYGLPLYYLRSDRLDLNQILASGTALQDEVDSAADALSYMDGYPTLHSGTPFWQQMPHEPRECFVLFQGFIDLAELEGIRLIDTLARQEQLPLERIREYYMEFYWSSRARAYDLFIVAAEAKKREIRTRKAENTHFTAAGGILDSIINRFNDEPDLIEKMDAKDLLDAFETMVKVQRLSLGLVGQNSSSTDKGLSSPGSSVEVILRQLTKNSGGNSQTQEALQGRLALLMSDPDTAMQAQELIVRATAQ